MAIMIMMTLMITEAQKPKTFRTRRVFGPLDDYDLEDNGDLDNNNDNIDDADADAGLAVVAAVLTVLAFLLFTMCR